MENKIVYGRDEEFEMIKNYSMTKTSEMIAVVGRRRVGKTYLIRRALEKKIDFEMTGKQNATKEEQLQNFVQTMAKYYPEVIITQTPKSWLEAFHILKMYLIQTKSKKKKVIFIDELPWIATAKSGFVESLAHFWNDWASENNVLLVTCGSAAAWMINHIVNAKGGLHNRIHHTIYLEPFTLQQTKEMLDGMKIKSTIHLIAELYMVLGGIPYYLSLFEKNKSVVQNIDKLIFHPKGKLYNEYENLFQSLFDNPKNHLNVIKILTSKLAGMTRSEISATYKGATGGALSEILKELEMSGFIKTFTPFQKSVKDTLYRLTDPYTLFYYKFLSAKNRADSYTELSKTQAYRSWCGYAFENICLTHIPQIKKKLGIQKISSSVSSMYAVTKEGGFQIDLLIDRADNIIHICEIKYYADKYMLTKNTNQKMINLEMEFSEKTKTKKAVYTTYITSNGLAKNEYSMDFIEGQVVLKDLFSK